MFIYQTAYHSVTWSGLRLVGNSADLDWWRCLGRTSKPAAMWTALPFLGPIAGGTASHACG